MAHRKFLVVLCLVVSIPLLAIFFSADEEDLLQPPGQHHHQRRVHLRDEPLPWNGGGEAEQLLENPGPAIIKNSSAENARLCDMECWRFRKLLQTWPQGKPKAAIYYLTHRLYWLNQSLHDLEIHFNRRFQYPVIIFHEKSFRSSISDVMRLAPDVYFQEIEFKAPDFLADAIPEAIPCLSHVSYRHMCRFQAKLVYEEPILEGLDFYWRLDDDSLITQPISYDVFKYMRDEHVDYGYMWIHLDSFACTRGLWDAAETFMKKHSIKPYFFDQWPSPSIFYNNFEIGRFSLWKSRLYKDYIEYIDSLGGIYNHRWGDAPIKGIAVSMFVPKNKTHLFDDIAYSHASYDSLRVRSQSLEQLGSP